MRRSRRTYNAKNIAINTAVRIGNEIAGASKYIKYYALTTLPSAKNYMFANMPIRELAKKWGSRVGYVGVAYGVYDAGEDLVQGKVMGH